MIALIGILFVLIGGVVYVMAGMNDKQEESAKQLEWKIHDLSKSLRQDLAELRVEIHNIRNAK